MTPTSHPVPALACDCHVHVFDPARFPYAPDRAYTPAAADVPALDALLRCLGVTRVVLVQPSVYGEDNACLLDALGRLGLHRARGVAVVDPHRIAPGELDRLHAGGVRGLRLNLRVRGDGLAAARQQVRAAGALLARLGWHLQVHAGLDVVVSLLDEFARLPVPVVVDHYAGGLLPDPASEDLMARLLAVLQRQPVYVKLSAPYRLWDGSRAAGVDRLARAFVQAAPERVLWGSDWPHTGGAGPRAGAAAADAIEPFREIDNARVLQDLLDCLPDPAARHRLLVDNPAALYGF